MSQALAKIKETYFPDAVRSAFRKLLIIFVVLNAASDFLYPVLFATGSIHLPESQGNRSENSRWSSCPRSVRMVSNQKENFSTN